MKSFISYKKEDAFSWNHKAVEKGGRVFFYLQGAQKENSSKSACALAVHISQKMCENEEEIL